MVEGIKAIHIHLKGLLEEYHRIVKSDINSNNTEFRMALEEIKKRISECESDIETLKNL